MYVAQLTIMPKCLSDAATEAVYDAASEYLACLYKHGQTYGDEIIAWVGNRLQITLRLAGPDAHAGKNHSKAGREELRKLRQLCKKQPEWTMISNATKHRLPVPDWRKETSLYLFTHLFSSRSPVRAGSTGEPVPTYLLPLEFWEIEYVNSWARHYRAHDKIWIDSGALEIPAYKQMADCDSALSQQGRETCRTIERCTKLPTYYHVHRFFGRRDKEREQNRKCPGCGRAWARHRKAPAYQGLDGFDFRCRGCRLVSVIAPDTYEQRHAHIGEWRAPTRRASRAAGRGSR